MAFRVHPVGTLGRWYAHLLLCLRPSSTLAAENLLLRKQLALYQERHFQHGEVAIRS